ncbi:G-type lectin S-receptor-like serine/threonine-protein kinase SD2-5 [Capsicum baccatum]|uniref:G-type lectin S-receptor-like serine/threonine-protein kinase SD2-5 n=1 Tax=Capsicum baccatum TaxID=33114 RepID=A0A2G2WEF6_CAPBA|nr:G-type lectin S-receptor-like serine/threonine-protein kinase SD2-5 [Capsicum baccatum]
MTSQPFDYPTANLSTTWVNSVSIIHSVDFSDGSKVRAILLRETLGPKYACGFYCNGNCESYIFAIFIVQINSISQITSPAIGFPQVVWSANRSKLVKINSTLQLTSGGDLVLRGVDGTLSWSTNTTGKSVVGLSLTVEGNLVLFDSKNGIVWQSFNHPNDALVPGQNGLNSSSGDCYLPSEIFSLANNEKNRKRTFHLRHQIGIAIFIFWKKRKASEDEEDFLDHVSGMPTRFSYDDLKAATENFTKKLGEGGFGSVFEGCLVNEKKIAVKCLDGIGQVKKSFLVEVETIGSIHHANLVQLIGFCTEKSHRLLIYEFMTSGSLEKWIYHGK